MIHGRPYVTSQRDREDRKKNRMTENTDFWVRRLQQRYTEGDLCHTDFEDILGRPELHEPVGDDLNESLMRLADHYRWTHRKGLKQHWYWDKDAADDGGLCCTPSEGDGRPPLEAVKAALAELEKK